MCDCHEFSEGRSCQDGIVCHLKVDHVKKNILYSEVVMLHEGNEELYLADVDGRISE